MWKVIKKRNLEIYTVIMVIFAIFSFISWSSLSYAKHVITIFMLLTVLHEWEETRYPGGFFDSFLAKLTPEKKAEIDLDYIHFMVCIMLLVDLVPGYFLDNWIFLTMMPVTLGILEAIMHTAGIFIHHVGKPYTPGLVSAILMLAAAVLFLVQGFSLGTVSVLDIVIGFVLMVLMYMIILSIALKKYGLKMSDVH